MRKGFVYILSNQNRTTFYTGVSNAIKRRALEHKTGIGSAFTKKYNLVDLVYFEKIEGLEECIQREKQLKNWHREWKINLVKEDNPEMLDLAKEWYLEVDEQLVIKSGWNDVSL
ncbi:MAG: GIY-YIG nuclease family protein [Bacteroidia bacterium]